MCGIVGYVGYRPAATILFDGLQRLEYRGYDSAGIAVLSGEGEIVVEKALGKLATLIEVTKGRLPVGRVGIGHTRWATHGKPSKGNAHPHLDCRGEVAVIHNGIVENYRALKKVLLEDGHKLVSETDSEVIVHLIEEQMARGQGLEGAVRRAMLLIEGAHAILVVSALDPEKIIAARSGNAGSVVIGYGDDEMFLASDLPAIAPYTHSAVFLENGEQALVTPEGARIFDRYGNLQNRPPQQIAHGEIEIAKGGYRHFMLREIMDQPQAATNALRGHLNFDPPDVVLEEVPFSSIELNNISRVVLVGMGTSLNAAMAGRAMMEQLARIPTEVENASEFRYKDPIVDASTLVVSITQSGETADTLAAMEEARRKGALQIAIANVENSEATRQADYTIYMRAGIEVGVASTKAFINSMISLYLLAVSIGRARGILPEETLVQVVDELARLPFLIGEALEAGDTARSLVQEYHRKSNFLYLGRGINYPVALEGALKLKEISYIHAEGYQAAEMKHGPIALIDENMPVVVIALKDRLYNKMLNTIEEVKARDGIVLALATEGDGEIKAKADHVMYLPPVPYLLSPLVSVIPLQLFAYHIAVRRGCDVDQPRNLAKSVTVE